MKLRMWSFFCTRRAVSPTVSKLDNKTDMVDKGADLMTTIGFLRKFGGFLSYQLRLSFVLDTKFGDRY